MPDQAKLAIKDKTFEFPIIHGLEDHEKAIDFSTLRQKSSFISYDPGFSSTGSCLSGITYLDGEQGVLRYRGYPIAQLAERASFITVAYLLIMGKLPSEPQIKKFSKMFTRHSMLHEDMLNFFHGYPSYGHPMGILSAMVCSLSAYYPELIQLNPTVDDIDNSAVELLSKIRTVAAFAYKKSIGEPFVYPRADLKYIPNFLNMMFDAPARDYKIDEDEVDALRAFLVLHADHEQNCSTSTVRMVGSTWANLFASVSAGICALWGPLHGGANQAVIEMLEAIYAGKESVKKYIARAKDKNDSFRLMGFGHRIYKNYDPRATILKKRADKLLKKSGGDPLFDIAFKLEEIALKDEYFVERKLYPNVDFYSGLILRAIGIPTMMFPVMFAIGRLPGWIAHWKEMRNDKHTKINRPRQIYIGEDKRDMPKKDYLY